MKPLFLSVCVAIACATVFCLADEKQQRESNQVGTQTRLPWQSYESMHEDSVHQFIKSPGLGMSRLVETLKRAETEETKSLETVMSRRVSIGDRLFLIKSIELIGIAKHDPPVVFRNPIVHSIRHKPDTREGSVPETETPNDTISQPQTSGPEQQSLAAIKAKTPYDFRKLTDYEQAVISTFRNGGDLTIRADEGDRVVLGPLRAQQECIKCHKGTKKGDVLGAFSYRLTPAD